MRWIDYRGWSLEKNAWIYGNPVGTQCSAYIIPEDYSALKSLDTYDKVYPESIGQFTEKLDKNGQKVYEGDIVKCYLSSDDQYVICEVIFKDGGFSMKMIKEHNSVDHLSGYNHSTVWYYDFEIIGNIFEIHILK